MARQRSAWLILKSPSQPDALNPTLPAGESRKVSGSGLDDQLFSFPDSDQMTKAGTERSMGIKIEKQVQPELQTRDRARGGMGLGEE